MRKTIGTVIGTVAISLCMVVSFYFAVNGERQRKEVTNFAIYIADQTRPANSNEKGRVSEAYPRSGSHNNAGS